MGEVRVPVTLINAYDMFRHEEGELAADQVRSYVAQGMVDTGAIGLVIPQFVLDQIGVKARGLRVAVYADGRRESVPVSHPILVEIHGRDTLEEALVLGDEVLIGQTILEKTDLLVDCANRKLIPNPAHPDQPVLNVK